MLREEPTGMPMLGLGGWPGEDSQFSKHQFNSNLNKKLCSIMGSISRDKFKISVINLKLVLCLMCVK